MRRTGIDTADAKELTKTLEFVVGLAEGTGDLLRMLYVQAVGNCTFTSAEVGADPAMLTERIDTESWLATIREAMNRRANSLAADSARSPTTTRAAATAPSSPTRSIRRTLSTRRR
jgi:hypothetical protein